MEVGQELDALFIDFVKQHRILTHEEYNKIPKGYKFAEVRLALKNVADKFKKHYKVEFTCTDDTANKKFDVKIITHDNNHLNCAISIEEDLTKGFQGEQLEAHIFQVIAEKLQHSTA